MVKKVDNKLPNLIMHQKQLAICMLQQLGLGTDVQTQVDAGVPVPLTTFGAQVITVPPCLNFISVNCTLSAKS